jgi:Putative zinc-finger
MSEEFNCRTVRASLWDYASGTLSAIDHERVTGHLDDCRECYLHRSEVRSLRSGLKALPARTVSPLLETKLRVIASREHSRQMIRRDLAARLTDLRQRARLIFDNLLRPIAVPAAGGILASFLCFGVIVDTLHFHPEWQNDIPVGLYTQVAIDDVTPFSVENGKDVMVELTIDAAGNVTDFEVPAGNISPDELREIGNLVLYSTFKPATSFGQRVTAKILVDIHHITIHG